MPHRSHISQIYNLVQQYKLLYTQRAAIYTLTSITEPIYRNFITSEQALQSRINLQVFQTDIYSKLYPKTPTTPSNNGNISD